MSEDDLSDIPRDQSGILLPQTRGHWWRIIKKFGLATKPPDVAESKRRQSR